MIIPVKCYTCNLPLAGKWLTFLDLVVKYRKQDGRPEKDELVYSINSLFVNKIRWNMGNGNINTGASFNYAYPTQGNYTITVVGLGEGGCKDSIELLQKVVVNPDPIANFEHDPIQYDELLKARMGEIEKVILPLLASLKKNTGKDYIFWPGKQREAQCDLQMQKLLNLTRAKL